MPISIRLDPTLDTRLAAKARQQRRSKSALIHEALRAYLGEEMPGLSATDAIERTRQLAQRCHIGPVDIRALIEAGRR